MKIGLVAALNINATAPTVGEVHVPMGLLCLSAVLEPAGYTAQILDPNFWIKNNEIPYKKGFEFAIAEVVDRYKCDAIGLSTLANSYHNTLRIADALRQRAPDTPIFLGGPQATHCDLKTLEVFDSIDAIVRGEGELVLLDLLDSLSGEKAIEKVDGITYRSGETIFKNKDAELIKNMDELPCPAYHLYPVLEKSNVPVDAGRGCPYSCIFCSTCIFWKRHFRQKSPKRIADEMEILKNAYQVKKVSFTHDLFTLDRKNVLEFCDVIKQRNLKMPWNCSTRIDAVDDELIKAMAEAGCSGIYYGIESGSQRMQKIIGKGFDVSKVMPTIVETAKNGVKPYASFIVGFPQETKDDLEKTIDLLVDILGVSELVETAQIHLLAVTTSTKLWDNFRERLRYDGFQSDQVGTIFHEEKDPLIRQYPELFSGHYYIPMPDVDRSFILDLYIFGFVANSFFRWTILKAAQKTGSASTIVNGWHKWRKKTALTKAEKKIISQIKDRQMSLTGKSLFFLIKYLQNDPDRMGWRDKKFDVLLKHEAAIMKLRNKLAADAKRKKTVKVGDVLDKKTYLYDPMALIREMVSQRPRATRAVKTEMEYLYGGRSSVGPLINFRKKDPPPKHRRARRTK